MTGGLAIPLSTDVHVRPAWAAPGIELSERALWLLLQEWADLGLVEAVADTADAAAMRALLGAVQQRGTVTPLAPRRAREPRIVTTADTGGPAKELGRATFEGVLMRHNEVATIGRDESGRLVREKFLVGAVKMPAGPAAPLVNIGHDRGRIVGHMVNVWDEGDEVRCAGVIADRTRDGSDAVELARLGSVARLSVEFLPVNPKITRESSGGRMVEHAASLLVGVGLVSAGAYGSARVVKLLDRAESGKQREAVRQRHLAELGAAARRAKALDARLRAVEVLERTRLSIGK